VAATHRRLAPPSLARISDTARRGRSAAALGIFARPESALVDSGLAQYAARRPLLGLSHPRIDGNQPVTHLDRHLVAALIRLV
jgi:hypothetical protein